MMKKGARVVGYIRVSTREQGDSGLGLDVQRAAIAEYCAQRGLTLVHTYEDVATGKTRNGRRGLAAALAVLAYGDADSLIVYKLDRLSRSVVDFAHMLATAREQGWGLVAMDLGVDTSTPTGKMISGIVMQLAEWERDMISARTIDALAEHRARGGAIGRPSGVPADVLSRIQREHAAGVSLGAIARGLNADGVPTSHGGKQWYPSTIKALTSNDA